MFSFDFCEIFKNTLFVAQLVADSGSTKFRA